MGPVDGGQALCEAAGSGPTVCEPAVCDLLVATKLPVASPLWGCRRQAEWLLGPWWVVESWNWSADLLEAVLLLCATTCTGLDDR